MRLDDWRDVLTAALEVVNRASAAPLIVIDELPYLLQHSPEIPGFLQLLYDQSQSGKAPGGRIVLCGSAMSVMSELLSGTKPLRGHGNGMQKQCSQSGHCRSAVRGSAGGEGGVVDHEAGLQSGVCHAGELHRHGPAGAGLETTRVQGLPHTPDGGPCGRRCEREPVNRTPPGGVVPRGAADGQAGPTPPARYGFSAC
jgi:hypothetical protein